MIKATDPVTPRTRLQVLDPFIAELHDALGRSTREGPDGETVRLHVSGRELTVDPWTSERIDPSARATDRLLTDCCRVVTQSVALLSKCARDLEALEGEGARGGAGLDGLRSELMLDAAIGGSLVRDVQAIIDELLKGGRVEEAGHLSKFHHQLRHTVYELRKQVTPEYRSTVETLAEQLSDTALEEELEEAVAEAVNPEEAAAKREAAEAAKTAPSNLPPEPRPIRRRPLPGAPDSPEAAARGPVKPVTPAEFQELVDPTPNTGRPSRTAMLAVALIVAALCLIAATRPGKSPRPGGVATAAAEPTFASVILLVEDHAPNLQVTVREAAWLQLLEERRIQLMRELTGGPTAARYEEVLVRDAEGKLLTSWTVPREEPPPDPRAKAKGRPAPPISESPGDEARREFERALAVPGKRGVQADAESD